MYIDIYDSIYMINFKLLNYIYVIIQFLIYEICFLMLSNELFDILNKLVFQQFLVAVTSQSNSKLLQQATATILSI